MLWTPTASQLITRQIRFHEFVFLMKFISYFKYLSKKLGADPVVFGYLQTTFAVVQLCGGPIFGRFGDIFGSRAALVLSFAAAALSYSILGIASTVSMLFLSRLPSVFMHAMQGWYICNSSFVLCSSCDDNIRT